ncbi:MAG: hypothetical protein IPJ88_06145 [Myxococcales bacterium]|nr:MAG: hypothetical protein IPJ88_06145 [Myxococcales bacterium]
MRISFISWLVVSLAMTVVSCSSDSSSSGSSLDADKQVSRLDETEQQVLKDEIEATFSDDATGLIDSVCTLLGISFSALDTSLTCEDSKADCVTEANSSSSDDVTDTEFADAAANCDVTVGELTACMQDLVDAFVQYTQGLTCDSSLEDLGEPPAQPASCSFTEQCALADEYSAQLDDLQGGM